MDAFYDFIEDDLRYYDRYLRAGLVLVKGGSQQGLQRAGDFGQLAVFLALDRISASDIGVQGPYSFGLGLVVVLDRVAHS